MYKHKRNCLQGIRRRACALFFQIEASRVSSQTYLRILMLPMANLG
ncbi:hypothetical protein HMPREF0091_10198 [Fannyhessea vaginae DSM 15829]|uniref:Uncharacterized protein n=1 Tax=Fannyhessea vaginae DSM 15829 TaxID=525256 RepID=F1T5W7_9ACTN|nr:hypothetical protein HMPREF0091_10198 [Fannyhessea vaginae DSM 15829]